MRPFSTEKIKTRLHVFFLLFLVVYMLSYVMMVRAPVPRETVLQMFPIVGKMFDGTLQFSDLLSTYAEHGMLANNLLMLLNAKIYDFSMTFEYFTSGLLVALIMYTVLYQMINHFSIEWKTAQRVWFFAFLLVAFLLCMVNFNLAAGMNNQIRLSLLTGILTAICIDHVLKGNKNWTLMVGTIGMMVLSMNICGSFYSFAMLPTALMVMLIYAIRNRNRTRWQLIVMMVIWILTVVLYLWEYKLMIFAPGDGGASMRNSMGKSIIEIFREPLTAIKSLLAWCGSSVIGQFAYAAGWVSGTFYIALGALMLCLTIWGIILYIRRKLYQNTWIPVFLIGYSLFLFIELLIGRPLGWDWCISDWYSLHSKMLALGCLWIWALILTEKERLSSWRWISAVGLLPSAVFCIVCMLNNYQRALSVRDREWDELATLYCVYAEDVKVGDNGLTVLNASQSDTLRAMKIMRENHLSVFRYEEEYNDMMRETERTHYKDPLTGELGERAQYPFNYGPGTFDSEYLKGVHKDGWAGHDVEINISSQDSGLIVINGYYPLEVNGEQKITICINDTEIEPYILNNNVISINIYTDPKASVKILLHADFSGKAEDSQDIRDITFLIMSIESI